MSDSFLPTVFVSIVQETSSALLFRCGSLFCPVRGALRKLRRMNLFLLGVSSSAHSVPSMELLSIYIK